MSVSKREEKRKTEARRKANTKRAKDEGKKPQLNAPCKVRAIDVQRSRAKNANRWLFGTLLAVKGDTATIICNGNQKAMGTTGRIVQAPKDAVVLKPGG